MQRSFHIESLGCAKNQVDSETIIALLVADGWHEAPPEEADVIIVNSCGFIAPAKKESIDTAFGFRSAFPGSVVVMAGCLSQRYATELAQQMPELDGVFGNRDLAGIGAFLDLIAGTPRRRESGTDPAVGSRIETDTSVTPPAPRVAGVEAGDGPAAAGVFDDRRRLLSSAGSVYIKVADGCDNSCAFCAIPLIRGRLRSRDSDTIVAEARLFVSRGIKEINLIAQDLGSYGRDTRDGREIVGLVRRLLEIPGEFWIRPLYVYPDRFPTELLRVMGEDHRVVPYFDIPMQHASTRVLRAMGRPGDRASHLELIRRIRDELPDAVVRTSLIVGFPGEDDDAFRELSEFVAEARVEWLGVFEYSAEEGTPAYRASRGRTRVARRVAQQRRSELETIQTEILGERLDRFVGREIDVLVEEPVVGEKLALGRGFMHAPEVDGAVVLRYAGEDPRPGRFVRARIVRRNGVDFEAVVLPREAT